MRPFPLLRLAVPMLRTAVAFATVSATSALAASDLQLSYDVGSKSPQPGTELVARVSAEIDAPLKLEYELKVHVERMAQTTQELRSIIEAMPGPGLAVDNSPPPPPVKFASPLQETITRLNHVDQLIADIAGIIQAMPYSDMAAPAAKPAPAAREPQPVPPPPPIPAPTPNNPPPPFYHAHPLAGPWGHHHCAVGATTAQNVFAAQAKRQGTGRHHRRAPDQGRNA